MGGKEGREELEGRVGGNRGAGGEGRREERGWRGG